MPLCLKGGEAIVLKLETHSDAPKNTQAIPDYSPAAVATILYLTIICENFSRTEQPQRKNLLFFWHAPDSAQDSVSQLCHVISCRIVTTVGLYIDISTFLVKKKHEFIRMRKIYYVLRIC